MGYRACAQNFSINDAKSIAETLKAMIPDVCYLECSNLGYHFYGLKNGNECHCGRNPNFHGKFTGVQVNNNACDVPCAGDARRRCGGESTLSLYNISKKLMIIFENNNFLKEFPDVRGIGEVENRKCQGPKKWTQFYSMTTPDPENFMSEDTEKYSTLRHYTGDLRDINLKGSLDLCGPVCKTGDTDCNANQE